jgi:prepilin signal peptidase PulO-like enzyme (type II secretory pathway)
MIMLLLILLGLALGSFVNALVWRLHNKKDGLLAGRSARIATMSLVRLTSFRCLAGSSCAAGADIAIKKLRTAPGRGRLAVLFVFSYIFWPMELQGRGLLEFVFWIVFLSDLWP